MFLRADGPPNRIGRNSEAGCGDCRAEERPESGERSAFAEQGLSFGPALLDEWADAHHEVGGFIEGVRAGGDEPVPLVMAWAMPAGPVADAVLNEITGHLCDELRRRRPDGLLLALHGAMVA